MLYIFEKKWILIMSLICNDPVMLNQWQPICSLEDINIAKRTLHTMLLGEKISYKISDENKVIVWRRDVKCEILPTKLAYGFVWVCLGEPPKTFFSLPQIQNPWSLKQLYGLVAYSS